MNPILAYAYRSKGNTAHAEAKSFYLFDMNTLLDLDVDIHAHMIASREGKLMKLKTIEERPPRWRAGGVRRGTKIGPKFSAAKKRLHTAAQEAKTFLTAWKAHTKRHRRVAGRLAKRQSVYEQYASSTNSDDQGCQCPPTIVDSLSLKDYLALQEDLQALSVRDALQYDADSQLLLNTCCSAAPVPKSQDAASSNL